MRLYKVVLLVNLALGIGVGVGYLWWGREAERLRSELAAAPQTIVLCPGGECSWSVRGIVRRVNPETNLILITHEDIPGLMRSMTMGFRTSDPKLLHGLTPGNRIEFTLRDRGNQLVVVAIRKEGRP